MAASAAARGGGFLSAPPPSSWRRLQRDSLKGLSFMLILLALTSSILLFFYSPSIIKLDNIHQDGLKSAIVAREELQQVVYSHPSASQDQISMYKKVLPAEEVAVIRPSTTSNNGDDGGDHDANENDDAFHDRTLFERDYMEMNKSLKIYFTVRQRVVAGEIGARWELCKWRRSAMEKAVQVKLNAIQVVCSSTYFVPGYIAHKDASIPQIWPRKGMPPTRLPSLRGNLAFYAGAMNSRVREFLVTTWGNDTEVSVHRARLKTPYSEALLGSKFCIHAKGFEVNTARIGDALYYGCVPVVLADHYDLPYADILDWDSFSVVLSTSDIPNMKKILEDLISSDEYLRLQGNVMKVQKHFL